MTARARSGQRSEIAFVLPWRTDVTATISRLHIITTAQTDVEFVNVPVNGFRHVWTFYRDPGVVGIPAAMVHMKTHTAGAPVTRVHHETVTVPGERAITFDPPLTFRSRPGESGFVIRPVEDGIGITVVFEWTEAAT